MPRDTRGETKALRDSNLCTVKKMVHLDDMTTLKTTESFLIPAVYHTGPIKAVTIFAKGVKQLGYDIEDATTPGSLQ